MIRNTSILKRVLTSKVNHLRTLRCRSYHASSVPKDALDMTDSFARRHSKFFADVIYVTFSTISTGGLLSKSFFFLTTDKNRNTEMTIFILDFHNN